MTLSNLRKTLQQLQPVLHNKKLNVGAVKEQVGVAFTYPNIHLSAWFLESSGHCCSDNRGSTVVHENPAIYLNEICSKIEEATGVAVSGPTVC